jgi:hypothetical protein
VTVTSSKDPGQEGELRLLLEQDTDAPEFAQVQAYPLVVVGDNRVKSDGV